LVVSVIVFILTVVVTVPFGEKRSVTEATLYPARSIVDEPYAPPSAMVVMALMLTRNCVC